MPADPAPHRPTRLNGGAQVIDVLADFIDAFADFRLRGRVLRRLIIRCLFDWLFASAGERMSTVALFWALFLALAIISVALLGRCFRIPAKKGPVPATSAGGQRKLRRPSGRSLDRQLAAAATCRLIAENRGRTLCGERRRFLRGQPRTHPAELLRICRSLVCEVMIDERGPSLFSSLSRLRRRLSMYNRVGSMNNRHADALLRAI